MGFTLGTLLEFSFLFSILKVWVKIKQEIRLNHNKKQRKNETWMCVHVNIADSLCTKYMSFYNYVFEYMYNQL